MNRNCRSSITINQRMFKLIGVILIFCLALSQIRISPVRIAFAESSYDYGDAPAPYPVLEIAGAKHEATGPTLGSNRDSESDGMPSSNADGDDTDGAPDDEDGITFGTVQVGQLDASVTVNVQSAPSGAKLESIRCWSWPSLSISPLIPTQTTRTHFRFGKPPNPLTSRWMGDTPWVTAARARVMSEILFVAILPRNFRVR